MRVLVDKTRWPLVTVTYPSQITREEWSEHLDEVRAFIASADRCAVVCDVRGAQLPDALQRKAIAEAVGVSGEQCGIVAMAVVLDSTIARGVITALNWVKPFPAELRVFAFLAEAEEWALARLPFGGRAAS